MVKSTTSKQKTLSREILVKELTAFEKRLDSRFDSKIDPFEKRFDSKIDSVEKRLEAKIDSTAQSFKEYVDSKLVPVNDRLDNLDERLQGVEGSVQGLQGSVQGLQGSVQGLQAGLVGLQDIVKRQGDKMDRYFNGIVKMIEGLTEGDSRTRDRLDDHERRLKIVEARS